MTMYDYDVRYCMIIYNIYIYMKFDEVVTGLYNCDNRVVPPYNQACFMMIGKQTT